MLVSNAGISKAATIKDHTIEDFDNLFATNVRSPFSGAATPARPPRGLEHHCDLFDWRARRGWKPGLDNPSILAYASTKGALETLVKNWAAILGPRGIRVNAVAPGVIDTDMSNFTKTEAGREATLGMQALKRIGKPQDVADVVAFLRRMPRGGSRERAFQSTVGRTLDWSPFLRQTVKTYFSANGELSHGIATQAVHTGI